MTGLVPDIGQNDGPQSRETLVWVRNVVIRALTDRHMPDEPAIIGPTTLDKLVQWLILTYQGLGPIVPVGEAPDLFQHPA